jgi:sporulation protein YlmC with PRC-barrel domain
MIMRHVFATAALALPLAMVPVAVMGENLYLSPTGKEAGKTEQTPGSAGAPLPASPVEQSSQAQRGPQSFVAEQGPNNMLASSLIGQEVVNPQGETLGEISDLLFDERGGLVALIVEVGGFLGLGGKTIGVSPGQFDQRADDGGDQVMVLPVTTDQLEQIAEFKSARDMELEREAAERATQRARDASDRAVRPGGMPSR